MLKRDRIFHKPRLFPSSKTRTILNRLQHFNTGKCCLVASWLAASRILGGERWQVDSHFHPVYCLFPPLRSLVQGYTKKGHTFIGSTGKKKNYGKNDGKNRIFHQMLTLFLGPFSRQSALIKMTKKAFPTLKAYFPDVWMQNRCFPTCTFQCLMTVMTWSASRLDKGHVHFQNGFFNSFVYRLADRLLF